MSFAKLGNKFEEALFNINNSEVQVHLRLQLRLYVMTASQSSYNFFHLNELMKFFKLANHLHSIKNNLKFQIGSVR
jgi:hypothetical protein